MGAPCVQVAGDGQRLEEHLRQHHRAPQVQHRAALVERRQRPGQAAEVAVAGGAERRAVGGWVLVDDLRADRGVDRDRHVAPRAPPAGPSRRRRAARGRCASARASPSPMPWSAGRRRRDRGVHLRPGLLRHAEGPVRQPALHVLAGAAERRQLVVVDRRRAVERDVGDDAAAQPGVDQRAEPDLDDVPADQEHDPAALARAARPRRRRRRAGRARRARREGCRGRR